MPPHDDLATSIGTTLADLCSPWPRIRSGAASIDDVHLRFQPRAERDLLSTGTVRSRRVEFATGRALLRRLIDSPSPILRHPDRRPALPPGTVGSLAHDSSLAAAIVAPRSAHVALGIDIEPVCRLDADEAAIVIGPSDDDIDPMLAFVLKEATFKAWATTSGGDLLDHHDVVLTIDGDQFVASVREEPTPFVGRYIAIAGRWLALAVVNGSTTVEA